MCIYVINRTKCSLIARLLWIICFIHLCDSIISVGVSTYEILGSDIHGERQFDQFGTSVSISADGTTFVASAPGHRNGNGIRTGIVFIFRKNVVTSLYQQVGSGINGKYGSEGFGSSVGISENGTTIVVGAPDSTNSTGLVRVYHYNATIDEYVQVGSDLNGTAAFDYFGHVVQISADGTTIVVGAPEYLAVGAQDNDGSDFISGYVSVYKYNSTIHSFVQFGADIVGKAVYDNFGKSVGLSANGTIIVVGAPQHDLYDIGNDLYDIGHVCVYKFNTILNSYEQVGSAISGTSQYDRFGTAVTLSGDGTTLVVGVTGSDGNGTDSGGISIYKWDPTNGIYTKFGSNIYGGAIYDYFGSALGITADGTTIVARSQGYVDTGVSTYIGHVRVYTYNTSTHMYEKLGSDINSDTDNDSFGYSVGISANGATMIVGAPGSNRVSGFLAGRVRLYSNVAPTVTTPSTTMAPTRLPTSAPKIVPTNPTLPTTNVPIISPPVTPPSPCGLFGWNLFCPRPGKCGFWRRFFRIGGCS